MKETLAIHGLGKLGSTMMSCFAHRGWDVIGMDINKDFVDTINDGKSPIYEPGVGGLIKAHKNKIRATTDPVEAALNSDVSFIIVPTPTIEDGSFTTQYVFEAVKGIAVGIKKKDSYHLIIVTSTVMPGETDKVRKLVEEISGKKCGQDFGIVYNPDFIALGSIVEDFLNPDMILIGEYDKKSGDIIEKIHKRLTLNDPEIHRMSLWSAELAKIGLNSYVTMKITFANIIGEIAEKLPGGDAHAITQAIGADSRVGKKYFRPGLGYSGPCFGRDNRAFSHAAARVGVIGILAQATDLVNDYQKNGRTSEKVLENLKKESGKVSILGLTYKENTTLVEESPSLSLIRNLEKQGLQVSVYDPAGMDEARKELVDCKSVKYCDSASEALQGTSLCFVATPWGEFRKLTEKDFREHMGEDPVVIDAWGLYKDFNEVTLKVIGKAD